MEDPEIVYCEVIDLKNNAQPTPQPSQNEEASILELLTANILQPRKIPAPRTLHKMWWKLLIENTSGHKKSIGYHFDDLVSAVYGAVFYD